jgi:hypothetical protein
LFAVTSVLFYLVPGYYVGIQQPPFTVRYYSY